MLLEKKYIMNKWLQLYGVSKHMSRLIVKLKAIKYEKHFFSYLSF